MKLLVVPDAVKAELDAYNATSPYWKIVPVRTTSNQWVLNYDLLTECGTKHCWKDVWEILGKCRQIEGTVDVAKTLTVTSPKLVKTYKPVGFHWYPGWAPQPNHSFGPPWNNPDTAFWWKNSWPDREPLQGWYNESQQSVVDRSLAMLVAHGVDFVCFNYFWSGVDGAPNAEHALVNTMNSSVEGIDFCIGWDPQTTPLPVRNINDLNAMLARWKTIMASPKYFKYDGKKVIFLGKIEQMDNPVKVNCGLTHAQLITHIRTTLAEDVYLIAGGQALSHWTWTAYTAGYNAYCPYNLFHRYTNHDTGVSGGTPTNYQELSANYKYEWNWWLSNLVIDFWGPLTCGFDAGPWSGVRIGEGTPTEIAAHLEDFTPVYQNAKCKGALFYAFNENGEGGQMEPTKKWGRQKLEVFRDWRNSLPLPVQPPAPQPNTLDSLYTAGWMPNSGTNTVTQAVVAKPAKSTDILTGGYTDPAFGTKIRRVTAVSDSPAVGNGQQRHEYSRRQAFNADGTKFLAQSTEAFWFLYDAKTLAKIDGGNTAPSGLGAIAGMGGDCEAIWHPTDPNKLWHTATNGGIVWYERDIVAKTTTTLFDMTPHMAALGGTFANVNVCWFNGEGRPSNDGRWWGFHCENRVGSDYTSRGFCMYDRQSNTVVWSLSNPSGNRPNWVGTSPLGNFVVASWYGAAAASLADEAALPLSGAVGVRMYNRVTGVSTSISVLGEHSDLAIDKAGNEVYVSIGLHGNQDDGVVDGSIYYRRLDNPSLVYNIPIQAYGGSTGTGFHISGCATDKPGWVVVGKYAGVGTGPHDGAVMVVELVPTNQKIYRVAHHRSSGSPYFAEPHPTCNRNLTQILFASDWGTGANFESYSVILPSWILN